MMFRFSPGSAEFSVCLNLLCPKIKRKTLGMHSSFSACAVFSAFQASFIVINTDTPHSKAFVESLFNYSLSFDLNRLKCIFTI